MPSTVNFNKSIFVSIWACVRRSLAFQRGYGDSTSVGVGHVTWHRRLGLCAGTVHLSSGFAIAGTQDALNESFKRKFGSNY